MKMSNTPAANVAFKQGTANGNVVKHQKTVHEQVQYPSRHRGKTT